MKTLLAAVLVLGSTVGATAGESYGDHRDYFAMKPVIAKRAPRGATEKTYSIDRRGEAKGDRVEMYGDAGAGIERTPGGRLRTWEGEYVPMHPRSASQSGFWSPIDQSVHGWELRRPRYR